MEEGSTFIYVLLFLAYQEENLEDLDLRFFHS